MEIIENENRIPERERARRGESMAGKLYVGVLLVFAGLLWLLYNFDVVGPRVFDTVFSWQMLLVVLGGYLLSVEKYASGTVLVIVGLVFLATDLLNVYIPVSRVILPVLLMGMGLAFLLSLGRRGR